MQYEIYTIELLRSNDKTANSLFKVFIINAKSFFQADRQMISPNDKEAIKKHFENSGLLSLANKYDIGYNTYVDIQSLHGDVACWLSL